jgi:protein-disulfide isomerase
MIDVMRLSCTVDTAIECNEETMGQRLTSITLAMLVAGAGVLAVAQRTGWAAPTQDASLLRLVSRAEAWYPDSIYTITSDERHQTPSGSYRILSVDRQCDSQLLSGSVTVVVDEMAKLAWIGNVAKLPFRDAGMEPGALGRFLEEMIPDALRSNMRINTRVEWGDGPNTPGALIPFWLVVETGYGEYRRGAAVTSDGENFVLGTTFQLDEDPVAHRRRLLASSDLVVWDQGEDGQAKVEIVEFSDFECPACRGRWPLIKSALDANGASMRHGMVSFPLTNIHPWAFRSACASWCVARQDAESLLSSKELFYSMQSEMEVSLVTPTSLDFVEGNGLDGEAFTSCYLRQPSLDAVHGQMALGHQLGVNSTPTYFVNGWKIQVPNESWFPGMIERLFAGEDLS